LKGRWVRGDIPKQLGEEGISASVSTVWRILVNMDLVWGKPRLRAPGSIRKNYRKRRGRLQTTNELRRH
ncbi:MAG: winged helix-turn-helix domain-containing protein, partial [Nitrososphaerota archaeon]|nr:winged helix-turn-helix domain-containing protein [Nitrososphaerota archaeon]